MENETLKGSCFCGDVAYEIKGSIKLFQYCHCSKCRKVSGSAHGSNLFVKPEQFRWITGEDSVGRYEDPNAKHFASCFCTRCGSSLPWITKSGISVVIPAGTLDDDPGLKPAQNIFWQSRAPWYVETCDMPKWDDVPKR